MLDRLYPRLHCRVCNGSTLQRLPRTLEAGDYAFIVFADWPFWLLFTLCAALGVRNWIGGVIAFIGVAYLYSAWSRTRCSFKCRDCQTITRYEDARRA